MSFQRDFKWQTNFYPLIEQILKRNAMKITKIEVANPDDDMKRATDFVISIKGGTVAVRIRRDVANSYRDLTIRSQRPNGYETELQKIRKGFADFYLYLWTSKNKIIDYWLVDIGKMRIAGLFDKPRTERWNRDKSSAFVWFTKPEIKSCDALISDFLTEPPAPLSERVAKEVRRDNEWLGDSEFPF